MAVIVVEREFGQPQEFGDLEAQENAKAWCLEQNDVKPLVSYLSQDRKRMICLYEAPDAEAVRRTQRQTGLPFARIWLATKHGAE